MLRNLRCFRHDYDRSYQRVELCQGGGEGVGQGVFQQGADVVIVAFPVGVRIVVTGLGDAPRWDGSLRFGVRRQDGRVDRQDGDDVILPVFGQPLILVEQVGIVDEGEILGVFRQEAHALPVLEGDDLDIGGEDWPGVEEGDVREGGGVGDVFRPAAHSFDKRNVIRDGHVERGVGIRRVDVEARLVEFIL